MTNKILPPNPDPLEDLFQQAGSRPQPDAAIADAVYQAVATEWERTVARPRHRWPLPAAVAAMLAILALALFTPAGPAQLLLVTRLDGQADQWVKDQWQALHPGDAVFEPALVRTKAASRLALSGPPGVALRMDENTELSMAETTVDLSSGAVFLDLTPLARGRYQVTTPRGVVQHVGTRFAVRYQDDQQRVMVRDGRVVVSSAGQSIDLIAGQTLQIDGSGMGTAVPLALYDEAWRWVAEVSPGIGLDGKSVADFLAWVATESGLQLAYQGPTVERDARRTILAGSVSNMSALEALAPVLSATRFTARIEDGLIRVNQTL